MSNAVTLAKLQKLAAGLARAPEALQRAVVLATRSVKEHVADEVRARTNPWGRVWAKNKPATVKQKGHGSVLTGRTGRLLRSLSVTAGEGKIETKATTDYARFVQRGVKSRKMRPRVILPRKAIPPKWGEALDRAIAGEIRRELP